MGGEVGFMIGGFAAIVSGGLVYRALGGTREQRLMMDIVISAVTLVVSGTAASSIYIALHLETWALGEGASSGVCVFLGGAIGLVTTVIIRGNWRRRRSQGE
jgi:hypothetical protein